MVDHQVENESYTLRVTIREHYYYTAYVPGTCKLPRRVEWRAALPTMPCSDLLTVNSRKCVTIFSYEQRKKTRKKEEESESRNWKVVKHKCYKRFNNFIVLFWLWLLLLLHRFYCLHSMRSLIYFFSFAFIRCFPLASLWIFFLSSSSARFLCWFFDRISIA